MFKKLKNYITRYLTSFIELQLVITLMSLPVLIHWGLPISYMSPLANLLFTPILIVFLWVSCIFAICAIIHLPCWPLVWLLDQLTDVWLWILSFAHPSWLMGFQYKTIWLAMLICALIVMLYTYIKPSTKMAISFLFTCCLTMLLARIYINTDCYKKLDDLAMIAIRANKKTYVIDYGALCKKQNFHMNIDYTIIPELAKQAGITTVDTLILCKSSTRLDRVAMQYAYQANIKTIIVTTKDDCYIKLVEAFKNSDVKILPLLQKKGPGKTRALMLKHQYPNTVLPFK